jgi:anti-sigma-K factor RskA
VGGLVVLGSGTTCRRRKGEEADCLVISGEEADRVGARKVEDRRLVLELVDGERDCATTVRRWSRVPPLVPRESEIPRRPLVDA